MQTSRSGVVQDRVRVAVKVKLSHPDYDGGRRDNNIALLELREPVIFNENIKPACLQRDASNDQEDLFAIGMTRSNGKETSNNQGRFLSGF